MKRSYLYFKLAVLLACLLCYVHQVNACSRVVYQGPNETIITARSMDWSNSDMNANLWIFPRGIERNGLTGPNSIKWKSKYGSIVASVLELSTTDGMNEMGLVANCLWLRGSVYPDLEHNQDKKGLSISLWLQYVLDNFATVEDAVNAMRKNELVVFSSYLPGTTQMATLHLAISDKTGDNAIFEYINGQLEIHHDRSYVTMTNEPVFEKQLAIWEYWKSTANKKT
jgi:penicillin V acylase-like amidase (Ntn superfamily)